MRVLELSCVEIVALIPNAAKVAAAIINFFPNVELCIFLLKC